MKSIIISIFLVIIMISSSYAMHATITEAEGYACMGEDKSRKQTEQAAMIDAKRKAGEFALAYIESETKVKDFILEKDIISAYTNSTVRVIQEISSAWYKDSSVGECYKVKIKAEVTPNEKAIEKVTNSSANDPSAPLNVKIYTDKKEYKDGDKIKIYIRSNKPFYMRLIYKDAANNMIQLLPNPYRTDNYFNGGITYEFPSGNDKFELEVSKPFGEENLIVYASTSQLGDISLETYGDVYQIKTKKEQVETKTRGVKLTAKSVSKSGSISSEKGAEFFEDKAIIKTGK
ncbi:MAG: DUF4384 domain-containing protein [Desulfobacterales bacterium]|nr:DUF4384 domain-containing protein [Desulfobacterales bacterium]MBF0398526.1 DUF4384 domain-containing protein [Desulfobacterales bacterium]